MVADREGGGKDNVSEIVPAGGHSYTRTASPEAVEEDA